MKDDPTTVPPPEAIRSIVRDAGEASRRLKLSGHNAQTLAAASEALQHMKLKPLALVGASEALKRLADSKPLINQVMIEKALATSRPVFPASVLEEQALQGAVLDSRQRHEALAAVLKDASIYRFPSKLFDGVDFEMLAGQKTVLAKALEALKLPESYAGTIIANLPPPATVTPNGFTDQLETTLDEAVVLAEADEVDELLVTDTDPTGYFAALPPEKARAVMLDLAAAIGALLVLAAWLGSINEARDAGIALAASAGLMRLYWRLADKL